MCWAMTKLLTNSNLSFQFLQSLFIISLRVFLALPRLQCRSTSRAIMLSIQQSFFAIWPNQNNQLNWNNVCMLLIQSFPGERVWTSAVFQVHIITINQTIAQSLGSSFSWLLTLGSQHLLAYNKTEQIYVLYIWPSVV